MSKMIPDPSASNRQENLDGIATVPAYTPKQKHLAALNLGVLTLGFVLYFAGKVISGPYSALSLGGGALCVLSLISLLIWTKKRAQADPALATRMAEARGRATRTQFRYLFAALAAIPFAFGGVWVLHEFGVQFTRQSANSTLMQLFFGGSAFFTLLQTIYARMKGR
jgi:hypothetical protein